MSPTRFGSLTDISRASTWYFSNRYPTAAKAAPRVNKFPSHITARFSAFSFKRVPNFIGDRQHCSSRELQTVETWTSTAWPLNYRSPRIRETVRWKDAFVQTFLCCSISGKHSKSEEGHLNLFEQKLLCHFWEHLPQPPELRLQSKILEVLNKPLSSHWSKLDSCWPRNTRFQIYQESHSRTQIIWDLESRTKKRY